MALSIMTDWADDYAADVIELMKTADEGMVPVGLAECFREVAQWAIDNTIRDGINRGYVSAEMFSPEDIQRLRSVDTGG